jgi:hypothetical protein
LEGLLLNLDLPSIFADLTGPDIDFESSELSDLRRSAQVFHFSGLFRRFYNRRFDFPNQESGSRILQASYLTSFVEITSTFPVHLEFTCCVLIEWERKCHSQRILFGQHQEEMK